MHLQQPESRRPTGRRSSTASTARCDDLVYIQVTAFDTRTAAQKKALFRCIAQRLGESPGLRPDDVFVNILEAARENWSVGQGPGQFA